LHSAEAEGVFTLFAILFVFVGAQLFATGLIGEYLTRIYDEARGRPRFLVREVYRQAPPDDHPDAREA
jgi:undecaprenyl-phosphate 4-deoxy-4-formamido-L-arabinose transferase